MNSVPPNNHRAPSTIVMAVNAGISCQVRRGDVRESAETLILPVSLGELQQGKVAFRGKTEQDWDEKSFSTDVIPPKRWRYSRWRSRLTKTQG